MRTPDVLRRANDYGVQVAVREDRLRMTAPRKPPDDLLAELRQHKAEIIAVLSRSPTKVRTAAEAIEAGRQFELVTGKLPAVEAAPAESGKPKPWGAVDYRTLFDERVRILEFDGGLTHSEAGMKAIEHCVTEWQNRHPSSPSRAGQCARCGKAEFIGATVVPFGIGSQHTWLHSQCWPGWHRRRRDDALAALRAFGILPAVPRPLVDNATSELQHQSGLRIAASQSVGRPPR
jgi:hypothetical protein